MKDMEDIEEGMMVVLGKKEKRVEKILETAGTRTL